jgi:uncharacterized damage-inducible protein DinB
MRFTAVWNGTTHSALYTFAMITVDYCKHFARYNRWQNQSIYAAAATLPDGTRKRNMGAYFKSIHATLNHLLVGDQLWLDRIDGTPTEITSLDQELYSEFDELRDQRERADNRLDRIVASLVEARLSGTLTFRRMSGDKAELTLPLALVMMQLFNHQTHHRGQVTTLLMQCGVDVGTTDLPMLPTDFASPVFGK